MRKGFTIGISPFNLLVGLFMCAVVGAHSAAAAPILNEGSPALPPALASENIGRTEYLPQLVKLLSPAVVNISVESESGGEEAAQNPLEGLPFFKKEQDRPFRSVGSGFIVSDEGHIITSNHVIEGSERIIVRLLDDRTDYPATVVGRDPKTDLALMKIKPKGNLPTVFVGDSDEVAVGEWVVAIGNQFHLGQTVTVGIVSAKSRRVPNRGGSPYDSFIQTDASINPGSSGGPLFNAKGQVIGINTAIFSPARAQLGGTGFNIGIGFAVPVNVLKLVVSQLKESGKVVRGLLGVKIQGVDDSVARALKLEKAEGALVADVIDGTPAKSAGFQRRDVIVSFDGHRIGEFEDLPLLVANTKVGSTIKIEYIRKGQLQHTTARIDEVKSGSATTKSESIKPNEIGLLVDEVTDTQAKALAMTVGRGVNVIGVAPGSTAEKAGLMRGDVIEEYGDAQVQNVESFEKLVRGTARLGPLLLTVRRKDGTRILTLEPE